jgi:hypothetical protein
MSNTTLDKIKAVAASIGACKKIGEPVTWEEMSRLFFSAQGREFCERHEFPGIVWWNKIKRDCNLAKLGIFVDAGQIKRTGSVDIALVGNTTGVLKYETPASIHRVILMHGAKARITVRNHAVVLITKIGLAGEVDIDRDETSTILW